MEKKEILINNCVQVYTKKPVIKRIKEKFNKILS